MFMPHLQNHDQWDQRCHLNWALTESPLFQGKGGKGGLHTEGAAWRRGRQGGWDYRRKRNGGWASKEEPELGSGAAAPAKGPQPSLTGCPVSRATGLRGFLALTLNWASGGPVMMTILSLTSGPSAGAICSSQSKREMLLLGSVPRAPPPCCLRGWHTH